MGKYNFDKEKKKIAEINAKYCEAYRKCYDAAADELRQGLTPGSKFPAIQGITTENQRNIMREKAADLRAEAMVEVNKIRDAVIAEKTAAPSEDAVRFLTLMSMREHVSQEEIDEAVNAYGDNYSATRALNKIAREHGCVPHDHPVERMAEVVGSLEKSVSRYGQDLKSDPDHVSGRIQFVNADLENL